MYWVDSLRWRLPWDRFFLAVLINAFAICVWQLKSVDMLAWAAQYHLLTFFYLPRQLCLAKMLLVLQIVLDLVKLIQKVSMKWQNKNTLKYRLLLKICLLSSLKCKSAFKKEKQLFMFLFQWYSMNALLSPRAYSRIQDLWEPSSCFICKVSISGWILS